MYSSVIIVSESYDWTYVWRIGRNDPDIQAIDRNHNHRGERQTPAQGRRPPRVRIHVVISEGRTTPVSLNLQLMQVMRFRDA